MEIGLGTLVLGVFLAETVKNIAKGSANWLKDNGKSLFYEEFIQLDLGEFASPEQITKQLEAKPEVIETLQKKIEASPDYVKQLFEEIKQKFEQKLEGKNVINAENIGTVINDSQAPITITNHFPK